MDQTLTAYAPPPNRTAERKQRDVKSESVSAEPGGHTLTLAVDNMHCGGCMRSVEQALNELPNVVSARANLSQRRVTINTNTLDDADAFVRVLEKAGFSASALSDALTRPDNDRLADLSRRLGVAAFATMNVMLLSVSVWSAADGDMNASVQSLFHWLSALIALPAIVYAGQPFFASSYAALRHGRVNMDVPISIGVILTAALSAYQTQIHGDHVYYDAAIMLLTFLLLGRLLDQYMRNKAANAASNFLKLRQTTVTVLDPNTGQTKLALADVQPGQKVLVAAGERVGVDGRVVDGTSDIDQSLITGESLPQFVSQGDTVFSGTLNLSGPLVVEVTAREEQSLLSEIATLLSNAEQQRGRYVQISDRAARLYAPLVHTLAVLTFIGWLLVGADWQVALPIAISVLIITCPCALALAVPAVQVAAAGRLLKSGIVIKSPDALERLADCDTVVYDKTGTLTLGSPSLKNQKDISDQQMLDAASLAVCSTHPYSKALVEAAQQRGLSVVPAQDVKEEPGFGLVADDGSSVRRLGAARQFDLHDVGERTSATVAYQEGAQPIVFFEFEDRLKPDVPGVLNILRDQGYRQEVLSGDDKRAVAASVQDLAISAWQAEKTPAEKVAYLARLKDEQKNVVMIGDGLNDAPSLAAAHASMSPTSAAHISQVATDVVFQDKKLSPIVLALSTAKFAKSLVLQNFALAIGYNLIFVPLAMLGWVTPLIAAIAMSLSSISVTANAMRVSFHQTEDAA